MKDWVIIIGALLILIILIDGIRRKRNERYGRIKVSRNLKKRSASLPPEEETVVVAPTFSSELPNGGARVVRSSDESGVRPSIEKKASAKSYLEKQSRKELLHTDVNRKAQTTTAQTKLNLDESVPILMESVADAKSRNKESNIENDAAERIEPSFSALSPSELDEQEDASLLADEDNYEQAVDDEPESALLEDDESDEFEEEEYEENELEQDEFEDDLEPEEGQGQSESRLNNTEPEEVLIINVMAFKGEMFNGGDLLDIALKCGMRYGDMDIFHRHTDAKGDGAHLFSMANMVKPGTFDLDAMDSFETPGVSLFMTLPLKADSMQSFDLMLDTARALAETLDGELKDEQRSVMTRQTIEHCRQRIRDFERQRLFRRPR